MNWNALDVQDISTKVISTTFDLKNQCWTVGATRMSIIGGDKIHKSRLKHEI